MYIRINFPYISPFSLSSSSTLTSDLPLRSPLPLARWLHLLPARDFALGKGPDKLQQQLPPNVDVSVLSFARHMEKDNFSRLLCLGKVRKARKIDEVAEISACILGYPEFVAGLGC